MRQDRDDHADSPLTPAELQELCALLAQLCDEQLAADGSRRLNELLDEHPDARHFYLRYIAIHSTLAATAGSSVGCSEVEAQLAVERLTLERFAGRITAGTGLSCGVDRLGGDESVSVRSLRWRSVIRWGGTLSALLLVAIAGAWWAAERVGTSDENRQQDVSLAVADGDAPRLDEVSAVQPLVAEVTFVSDSAVWRNPNSSYIVASSVRAGQRLALERGQVELTYNTGAKLLLTGPSEFLVQPTGGKLRRGELVARVPEAGHGFTIETPHGKVIDLGTEFGVVVDDFGVSQVSVFEGKVETLPTGPLGRMQDKFELTSGRAIQWTESSIIPISVQGGRYERADRVPQQNRSNAFDGAAVACDYRGGTLIGSQWKTIGSATPSGRGLRMTGIPAQDRRPYLLTDQEFDPSLGPITVLCDLRFEGVSDAEHASCAILTRTSDEKSVPGKPWHDLLARSLRCCFRVDPDSGEGLLEAGTKYEADREQMNISWGGFARPKPDTLYRLKMRDDGLKVSFTVSQADNPAARKTITCRSLFRGSENFIALEGSSRGAMIVERFTVFQESKPLQEMARQVASTEVDIATADLAAAQASEQLAKLRPANATLLLKDDFGGRELNSANWKTLGDVALRDGEVQLGLPNVDGHIDTWRARPYLLTKEKFDTADGPIVVVGKATFAENFLHGYGGSFAVMTRADDAHGGGPAWENSILRRGVRANFWPAAYGFDHSLEIHEKPSPNTISLLVAEGFSIVPSSRAYLFQIVDDGRAVTMTFMDAGEPTIRKTVSHPTSPAMRFAGHMGFESCWGSPVQLDDVQIFQVSDAAHVER